MIKIRAAKRGDTKAIGQIQVDTWRDAYAGLLPDNVLLRMSAEIESGRWVRVIDRQGNASDLILWQIMLHQANHATQHRSEVAVMLTQFGHSPGDLDVLDYVESML